MARQVVIDILGDSKNFTRATQEATAVSGHMTAGLGKASGAAKTLEKDLMGMGRGMAANIPVAGGFGGALGGLPVPAMAAAAAIGGLVVAGKSMIEISDKWEAAQRGLTQALAEDGNAIGYHMGLIEEFIKTNKRFVSDQAEVVDSYAGLAREGLTTEQIQEDLNLALDLSAIKHIGLRDATTLLQQVEMGRGRALIPLGIQMKEYPVLTETATQAAKKLADAEKAVHAAQLAHTDAVKKHGPHSAQAKRSAEKLAEANKELAEAHNFAADRAKASAEIHDILHTKLDGGRKSTNDMQQSMNQLGNTWQSIAEKVGPKLVQALGWILNQFNDLLTTIGDVINAIARLIDWISKIDASKIPVIGGIVAGANQAGAARPAGSHHRAMGGSVLPNSVYTVGEQGPETLVMGSQGGMVIPHGGGGGGMVIHNHFEGAFILDGPTVDRLSNLVAQRLSYTTGR